MVGAELPRYKELLEAFLQGAHANMQARGFMDPPVSYLQPQICFTFDRAGKVAARRVILTWPSSMHSLLFFYLWNNFHWASEGEEETIILQVRNRQWNAIEDKPGLRNLLASRATMEPHPFLQFAERVENMGALGN